MKLTSYWKSNGDAIAGWIINFALLCGLIAVVYQSYKKHPSNDLSKAVPPPAGIGGKEEIKIDTTGNVAYIYRLRGTNVVDLGDAESIRRAINNFSQDHNVIILSIGPETGMTGGGSILTKGAYITYMPKPPQQIIGR